MLHLCTLGVTSALFAGGWVILCCCQVSFLAALNLPLAERANDQGKRVYFDTAARISLASLDFEMPSSKGLDVKSRKLPLCHCSHKCLVIATVDMSSCFVNVKTHDMIISCGHSV